MKENTILMLKIALKFLGLTAFGAFLLDGLIVIFVLVVGLIGTTLVKITYGDEIASGEFFLERLTVEPIVLWIGSLVTTLISGCVVFYITGRMKARIEG